MMQLPREPMLTAPTSSVAVPPGYVAEPKWDGFRIFVLREVGGAAQIRSRHGTDLTADFPEIAAAADALPDAVGDLALDAELVLWHAGRLDFEALLRRLNRASASAWRLAAETPANVVVFDVLHYDSSMIEKPYRARRQALERLFSEFHLGPPWSLCPATTDPQQAAQWLTTWSRIGIEGLCFKDPDQAYMPGRSAWLKYRIRDGPRVATERKVSLRKIDSAG